MPRVVMIDNHDSFTYNLVHYLQELSCEFVVVQSDAASLDDLDALGRFMVPLLYGPGR